MFIFGRSFSVYCDNCGERFLRQGSCASIFETIKSFKKSRAVASSFIFDESNNKTLCYNCKKGFSKKLEKIKKSIEELRPTLDLDVSDFLINKDNKTIKIFQEGNDFYLVLEGSSLSDDVLEKQQIDMFRMIESDSHTKNIIKIKLDKMNCQKLSKILGDISLMQHYIECLES